MTNEKISREIELFYTLDFIFPLVFSFNESTEVNPRNGDEKTGNSEVTDARTLPTLVAQGLRLKTLLVERSHVSSVRCPAPIARTWLTEEEQGEEKMEGKRRKEKEMRKEREMKEEMTEKRRGWCFAEEGPS